MIELSVQVSGESQVVARLDGMTEAVRIRLRAALEQIGPELRDAIAALAPSRSGKLRKSIKAKLLEKGDRLQERVGPSLFYGRFLELGVPEKTITVKRRGRFGRGVIGVRTRLTKSGTVLVTAKRGKVEVGQGATYTRRHHIRAHPFFAPAFGSMRDRIIAQIADAVREGTK